MRKNTVTQQIEKSTNFFIASSICERNEKQFKADLINALSGNTDEKNGYYNKLIKYTQYCINSFSDSIGYVPSNNDILSLLQGTYFNVKNSDEVTNTEIRTALFKNVNRHSIEGISLGFELYDRFNSYGDDKLFTTCNWQAIDNQTAEDPKMLVTLISTMLLAVEKGIPLTVLNKEEAKVTENTAIYRKVKK